MTRVFEERTIYSRPALYAMAFAYRDIRRECEFLRAVHARYSNANASSSPLSTFLEIGAGPADHALEFARRQGVKSMAIDLSEEMVVYGRERARADGVELDYRVGDMRDLSGIATSSTTLAAAMIDTCSYLLTNEDMRAHLRAIARVVSPGGVYVMELAHPKDLFTKKEESSTDDTWSLPTKTGTVTAEWKELTGSFNPITQTRTYAVSLAHVNEDGGSRVESTGFSKQRAYTANEIEALVSSLSDELEIADWFGSHDVAIPFDARKEAWRMIVVLRRR